MKGFAISGLLLSVVIDFLIAREAYEIYQEGNCNGWFVGMVCLLCLASACRDVTSLVEDWE